MRRAIILVLLLLIAVGAIYAITLVAFRPAPHTAEMAFPEASRNQADPKSDRLPAKKPTSPEIRPSFGLVRIEPDGSVVVAGKAEPEVKVELVVGSRAVGETTADSDGNFVIVLEEPLPPGEYQLVLRSTTPAGDVVVLSAETAPVSVPITPGGEVQK